MDDVTATGEKSMQDIASALEAKMFGGEDDGELETNDEEVSEDAEELPNGDDSNVDEDDSSEDLDESDEEEDLDEDDLSLAGYLGIDEERLIVGEDGKIAFNAIIDGETKAVPLTDLAKIHQLEGHVNNKSVALQNERKEFEDARIQVAQGLQEQTEYLEGLTKQLEDQLVGEYQSIDWDQLRATNPSEWSALRQEYAERARSVQGLKGKMAEESQKLKTEQQQSMNGKLQEHLSGEYQQLLVHKPTWSDPKVREEEQKEMRGFLTETYGYADDALNTVSDHRLIRVISDAMAFRNGTKKAAEKKIKKDLPKFRKPGASKGQHASLAKARKVKASKKALKQNGSTENVAAAILDRM